MNKRSLLSFAMCSLLLGSLPVGLVGCKDYDGDIKKLDTTTGNLSSQVSTLQSALDAAKQAADAAANDAKAAAAKADSATQEVALAKQAVEEAKAEAIQTALDAIKDGNFASTDDLAALSGKLEGIETGLSKIEADFTESQKAIAELNKQISAMDVQIKALEKLKEDMASLDGLSEKVAAIDGITAELNQLKADAAANKTDVADVKNKLANVSSEISTQVTNAVNTIAGILAQRLTSVTLVPELYMNGIPTILFESGKYDQLQWKANDKLPAKGSYSYVTKKVDNVETPVQFNITNGKVEAKYRLNPATITESDIDLSGLSYFTHIAQTRAEEEESVLAITGASVGEGGILTVTLDNTKPFEMNKGLDPAKNEIYTVSLKVPIQKKHLFEGETSADVYSEFSALDEVTFVPSLGLSWKAIYRGLSYARYLYNDFNQNYHSGTVAQLYDSYQNFYVVKQIAYNESYDLNELFIGRMANKNNPDTIAYNNLAKYGLAIRYRVAEGEYTPLYWSKWNEETGTWDDPKPIENKTNQQAYAKITGSILTSQAAGTGTPNNKSAIGKCPIIVAEMYDTRNNNIVDAEYFKVEFTAESVDDITLAFSDLDKYTKGDACGLTVNLDWAYMTKNLLEELNMSKDEFSRIYNSYSTNRSIPNSKVAPAFVTINNGDGQTDVPAITLSADPQGVYAYDETTYEDRLFGKLPTLKVGDNNVSFGNVITFYPSISGYPKLNITLNWNYNLKVTAAEFGEAMATIWGTNNTMQIRVMPMDGTNTTAEYGTNILAGRIKPYVTNLLGCATYSINYAPTKEQNADLMKALNNYVGEPLEFTGVANGAISKANQKDLTSVLYSLDKSNANARKLVCDGGTIKVNWTSNINGLKVNEYNIGSIYLQVLPILKYTNGKVASITPALTPVDATMNIQLLDAYNNVVAEANSKENPKAAEYWKFYGIESVTYGATKDNPIKIGSGDQTYANATKLSDTVFDVTISGNKITFISNGYSVTTASKIYVPFVAKHAWGELKGYAVVDLKVTPGSN